MNPEISSRFEPTDPRELDLPETRLAAAATPHSPAMHQPPEQPVAGMQIGEFLLLEEIGHGAFGHVFLAGQETLNRRVALKVSRLRAMSADEGKSLGGLEHDHIVKVYSAFTHPGTGWHCLCLQYVPGADLRSVIDCLHRGAPPSAGRDILSAVDTVGRKDATFDPAALRDRDSLAADNFAQAVCRLGGRLAEALAFAHVKGVLHCDIKPGNILVTPYGRPMLADFNVAFDRSRRGDEGGLGGTRAYMAPEYAAALKNRDPKCVDGRCDIYSLGVVLFELATGARPDAGSKDALDRVPRELAAVIRRCLEPDPARRYQSAAEVATALAGAWQLLAARRALPKPQRFGRWVVAHPIFALAIVAVIPHLAASLVNIAFNAVQIDLYGPQKSAFAATVLAYNFAVYPIGVGIVVWLFRRVARPLPTLARMEGPEIDNLRRRIRQLGWQTTLIGALGWFPGGLIFPLAIDLAAGPFEYPAQIYVPFVISFTLAGLIGVVFSYLGVQYVVFGSLLPRVGNPDTYTPTGSRAEVRPLVAPFSLLVLLASAVPLTGAVLLIAFTDGGMTLGFRLLAAGLIGLGAGGVAIADRAVRRIHRMASIWGVGESEHEMERFERGSDTSRSDIYVRPLPKP
jgi:eukaryotic-like serine/threonine-protein kinase